MALDVGSGTPTVVGINPYTIPGDAVTWATWTTDAGHTVEQRQVKYNGRIYLWLRLIRRSTDYHFGVTVKGVTTYCAGPGADCNCTPTFAGDTDVVVTDNGSGAAFRVYRRAM